MDQSTTEELQINEDTLKQVLTKMLHKAIALTDYTSKRLYGGTLGDVRLIQGTATAVDGEKLSFAVVLKIQKKWERYGDPHSWRREYDLYQSVLDTAFSPTFRWPKFYHAEMNREENEIQIWMEYIQGVTGLDLDGKMYERAAEELGRFQGKLYAQRPDFLRNLPNLSQVDFMKNDYLHYSSWNVVTDYIRSQDCEISRHLCEMLIDIDNHAEEIFSRIEKLPVVLCHRDFWVTNIFYCGDKILLIDWDTAGWGYLGEDMASLIADEADVNHMVEYYHRCVPAYYRGFSQYADTPLLTDHCIWELILVIFGYRLVEWYLYAKSPDEKKLQIDTLQRIYEMKV